MIRLMSLGGVLGFLILGVGGRLLMRLLAFTTPESPRFTWKGTAQILIFAAVWGMLTAPLIRPFRNFQRFGGAAFGLTSMLLALLVIWIAFGFDGRIVAPAIFIAGTIVLFPLLFVFFGVVLLDQSDPGPAGSTRAESR